MKRICVFFFLLGFGAQAQEGIESNLWLNLQVNYTGKIMQGGVDASYRSNNYFVKDPRQRLVRAHGLFKVGTSNFWLGAGFAYFETIQNEKWNQEARPFAQLNYSLTKGPILFRFRYRNELRCYLVQHTVVDRSRFQFQLFYTPNESKIRPFAGAEFFYSIQNENSFEYRYAAGLQYEFSKSWQATLQYTLQFQQRYRHVAQNIIGFTMTKNFSSSSLKK